MSTPTQNNTSRTVGLVVGLLASYPVSYFFQPGVLRAKVSLGDYISHANEVIQTKELQSTVIACLIICPLVGALLGHLLGRRSTVREAK